MNTPTNLLTKNQRLLFPLLLVTACILVYYPILDNDFMYKWDDQWQVLNDYTYIWSWETIIGIFSDFFHGQYSPINQLIYTLLYKLFGVTPIPFHLASLLLHIANVLLVFGLIRSIIAFRMPEQKPLAKQVAFCATLLFAIHPLQVEAVAWISASKILVCSLFYLLAMRSYYLYVATGKVRYYYLVFPAFLLAFGGKEQAVTLPLALLWIDLAMGRNMKDGLIWQEKISFIVVSIFFSFITFSASHAMDEIALKNLETYPLIQRIPMSFYSISEYLTKTLIPIKLYYIYPFPMKIGDPMPYWFWIYPLLTGVLAYSFWPLLKRPPVYLGLLFFLIQLSLVIHIIPFPRIFIVADRYCYLACTGVLFILVWFGILYTQKIPSFKKPLSGLFLVYCLYLGCYAHLRTKAWENDATLKSEITNLAKQDRPHDQKDADRSSSRHASTAISFEKSAIIIDTTEIRQSNK